MRCTLCDGDLSSHFNGSGNYHPTDLIYRPHTIQECLVEFQRDQRRLAAHVLARQNALLALGQPYDNTEELEANVLQAQVALDQGEL